MQDERDSDLTSIGDVWGVKRDRVWPPEEASPGVVFRRIPVPAHAKLLQQAIPGGATFLVPAIQDERAYYANLAQHNYREEDDRLCGVCKGAGYLRYERPLGHAVFGQMTPCKACFVPKRQPEKQPTKKREETQWWQDK